MENFSLVPLLEYIDPDDSYTTWIQVGMALKKEGYPLDVWDTWSRKGTKYNEGECAKKWESFREETETTVSGATITQLAKDRGWVSQSSKQALDPNLFYLSPEDLIDPTAVEPEDFHIPTDDEWMPYRDAIRYLKALFKPDEHVGIAFDSFQDEDGKWKPRDFGRNQKTCQELVNGLEHYKDVAFGIRGLQNEAAGGWVRINPMDGEGTKNNNVTDWRYCLVESDKMPLGKQLALIRKMELPCAAIVYSGGKSVHAIVHVDASSQKEYRERVSYVYDVCNKNGFTVDVQNKNPSRLSRFPGVTRNGVKQFLIDVDTGQKDYDAWVQWIGDQKDDLPPFTDLGEIITDLPEKSPAIMKGALRQGHKLMVSGPSKAGKSFFLIELCIALATGKKFLQWQCRPGRVLYINLEIDGVSCEHRFQDIYRSLGMPSFPGVENITLWNLRGSAIPMDKLAPTIVRRCKHEHFSAVVIDPIYKVITGDENTASDMAYFGNQFDFLCKELGCSVIYCHHHSKGSQGGKRSIDRASGSGVFSRDADAIIDLTPLELSEDQKQKPGDVAFCVTSTFREFAATPPFAIRFDYPIHTLAPDLDPNKTEGSMDGNRVKGNVVKTQLKDERYNEFVRTLEWHLAHGEEVNQAQLANELDVAKSTINNYLKRANEEVEVYRVIKGRSGKITRVNDRF